MTVRITSVTVEVPDIGGDKREMSLTITFWVISTEVKSVGTPRGGQVPSGRSFNTHTSVPPAP